MLVHKVKKIIDKVLMAFASLLTVLLVLGVMWQFITRFFLNDPSMFTDELMRFLLVWTALLGATYAFGTNQHLAITFLKNKFQGIKLLVLTIIIDLITLGFAILIMIKGGFQVVGTTMSQLTPILKIPMGVIYSIVPICGIIIVIYKLLAVKEYPTLLHVDEGEVN